MNKLQHIFSSLTGFHGGHQSSSPEAEGWQDWSVEELELVIDNLELPPISKEEAETLRTALDAYKSCDTGRVCDRDAILNELG